MLTNRQLLSRLLVWKRGRQLDRTVNARRGVRGGEGIHALQFNQRCSSQKIDIQNLHPILVSVYQ